MGSSARRKKQKAADFAKPKLKVGKTRPKTATNGTDTSFRSKSIVLSSQSLSTTAPSATASFSHNLSLLGSKSDSQKKDALAALTNALNAGVAGQQPAVIIIARARPLLLDASRSVRANALTLLKALDRGEVAGNVGEVLIYAHIALTHMVADIRVGAVDVLSFLLDVAGEGCVACKGGWTGTIRRLVSGLGWGVEKERIKGWTGVDKGKLGDGRGRARVMGLLAEVLDVGLGKEGSGAKTAGGFPLWDREAHGLPTKPDPFGYLGLFVEQTAMRDGVGGGMAAFSDDAVLADVEGRAEALRQRFEEGIRRGVAEAKKEGGEVGRAARGVERALAQLDQT